MKTHVYSDNEKLCLTPEHKIEKWKQLIYEKAAQGNTVKLYSDTESTGFEWSNKGRPIYDPQTDRKYLARDAAAFNIPVEKLEEEAKNLEGRVDRLIEYAFVVCYTDHNGDTHLLEDDEGEPVYLHEMIHPNKDELVPEHKRIEQMPLVPYSIHRTSFAFLEGKEHHPFLDITLPHEAPSTKEFFDHFMEWFSDYEDDNLFDNIYMFFHNGDGFDVPFIDAELKRATDGEKSLRDLVQTYDTLKIVKNIIPSDVQKYIAKCQHDEFYGGDPSKKENKEEFIQPTQKNLDNVVRMAKFLIDFDPEKPQKLHEKWQQNYAQKIVEKLNENGLKPWDTLQDYLDNPSLDKDFSTGATGITNKNSEIKKLVEGYKKFRQGKNDHDKQVAAMNKHEKVVKNLFNIRETIEQTPSLQKALNRLNNTDRSAHGARVDSQLFMDSLIVIEGGFYPKPKLSPSPDRNIEQVAVEKLPDNILSLDNSDNKGIKNDDENIKETVKKISEKYNNLNNENRKKPKIK